MTELKNLFSEDLSTVHMSAAAAAPEQFETLLKTPDFSLERIVSMGHKTPEGQWLTSNKDEWVMLLQGRAGLLFEGEAVKHMVAGDAILIPAKCRHRVEYTLNEAASVWLALHFKPGEAR